jgi:uncharacterized membrane protein YccC
MIAAAPPASTAFGTESKAPVVLHHSGLRPADMRREEVLPHAPILTKARNQGSSKPIVDPRWVPWIFAAKTTASGLLALLVAFTFNLDQPKWALLSVFIVAQPQSGLVLAKSFYRIIGTLVGASGALVLVSLFAQERVLFLGTLALWIGLCTFASKYARNFTAYGFVLSGYTAAIVGVPGALDPGNAFFTAVARVTEVSLGIMCVAAISHLVLPVSLADTLRRAVAAGRRELADYTGALLRGQATGTQRSKLLAAAIAIENLHASAIFEDRDVRSRSRALRRLDASVLAVMDAAHLLGRSLDWLRQSDAHERSLLDGTLAKAAGAIDLWRSDALDTAGLSRRFVELGADLPPAGELYRDQSRPDEDVIRRVAVIDRLREFLAVFAAFAQSYAVFASPDPEPARAAALSVASDRAGAVWAGLRAAAAFLLVSAFWILADWPSGATAAILAGVATARLATMEHPVQSSFGGVLIFVLAGLPAFVLIEILLPDAEGFAMFSLAVAPVLFCCAFLMAHEKTAGIGFLASLYFASVAVFQDRMAYDPIAFVNTSIAIILAIAVAGVLFAIVAPETPEAARRRFARAARKLFARLAEHRPLKVAAFETAIADALAQLRRDVEPERSADVAVVEAGITLLGAGRELIHLRDDGRSLPITIEIAGQIARALARGGHATFARAERAAQSAAMAYLAELRADKLGAAEARRAVREMVAFAAIGDELDHRGDLLRNERAGGAASDVA